MSDIVEKKLRDIGCTFISGFGFKSSDYTNNGIPLIKIGNIQNRIVSIDVNGTSIPEHIINDKNKQVFLSNNDVLIAMTGQGSVGRVGRLKLRSNDKALLNQRVGKFICDENNINIDYLYYILTSDKYQDYLFNTGAGSGQPNLSPNLILQTEIPWWKYEIQKAIAEVLSSLDDKIDLLHRQNKTLEQMAETLFRQWFVEEAGEDWGGKPLGECVDIAIGRTPPRKQKQWFSTNDKDVKWISIKDMGDSGIFLFDTSEYLTAEAVDNFNIPVIPKNTVVLSFKMTLGRVGITSEEMLSNEAIAHFKFNNETPFSKEYLYLFLKTYPYQTLGSTSSIVTSINSKMIKELIIPIPDRQALVLFDEQVKNGFLKIKTNQHQIRTLQSLRDTLLPKLMSGEVRIASNG